MPKKPKAGRTLEILAARIEGAVGGLGVAVKSPDHLEDKVAGGTREVDASPRSTVGSAEVLVIVECRDRGRVADVTWIEQIKSKRDAVGASKVIAVSSGTFSKKALIAASQYGIDARTLAQVDRAEVRRWTGFLEFFQQNCRLSDMRTSVVLAGPEPLAPEVTERFDRLIADKGFDAPFIALIGREGLLSPLDVIRRSQTGSELPTGKAMKVTVAPGSTFVMSNDSVLSVLGGPPPADGSPAQREHVIEFPNGEAFLSVEGVYRTLRSVRLNFAVHLQSSVPVESEAYRYSSSKGVIEVATRTAELGGRQLTIVEHRQVAQELEPAPDHRKLVAQRKPAAQRKPRPSTEN